MVSLRPRNNRQQTKGASDMRHTHYIAASAATADSDTYQIGQIRERRYAGQRILSRLAGYRRQRASGNGERGAVVGVWLPLDTWTRRRAPEHARKVVDIRRNLVSRASHLPMNRSVKTKAKRYQGSAPPRQFPTQIPTEHITCVGR